MLQLQTAIQDLKDYFQKIVGMIGVELYVFDTTRQREVLHITDRIKYDVFPSLERNYIDVSDFNIIFFGFNDLINKLQSTDDKKQKEKFYQNLKTMAVQANIHIQNFSL